MGERRAVDPGSRRVLGAAEARAPDRGLETFAEDVDPLEVFRHRSQRKHLDRDQTHHTPRPRDRQDQRVPSAPSPRSIEWPTAAVAIVIAGALGATLLWGDRLPVPLTVGVLAVVAAWYNSLQHEIIHGHPTPWPTVNRILGSVPVTVVVPFERYRDTHLAHHRDEFLTDPELDPESFYGSSRLRV